MSTLTASQSNLYWNVFRNTLTAPASPETGFDEQSLFFLQADPRYITYLEDYLELAPDMSADEKASLLRDAQASHDAARAITEDIFNSPAELTAGRVYSAIESSDVAMLGVLADNPGFVPDPIETGALPPDGTIHAPLEIVVTGGTYVQWPVNGEIVNGFGDGNNGVDIRVALNTEVGSISDGEVIYAGENETFGNLVIIKHNENNYAAYGNLGEITVAKGHEVVRGQPIALMSEPGVDLHFEMRMGTDNAPVDPVEFLGPITAAGSPVIEEPAYTDYTVQAGDSLWTIAKTHYGLTDNTEIMNAVEHIANANDMTPGTMANHLRAPNPEDPEDVQVIRLPDASILPTDPAMPLDWEALHHETVTGQLLRGDFSGIDGGEPIIFSRAADGSEPEVTLGIRGNLTNTIKEAASQFDVTLTTAQAYALADRVAEANGIEDANVVRAGQPVRFTRDMFGGSAPS